MTDLTTIAKEYHGSEIAQRCIDLQRMFNEKVAECDLYYSELVEKRKLAEGVLALQAENFELKKLDNQASVREAALRLLVGRDRTRGYPTPKEWAELVETARIALSNELEPQLSKGAAK